MNAKKASNCRIFQDEDKFYAEFTTPDDQIWRAVMFVKKDGAWVDNKNALLGEGAYGKVYTVTNSLGEERALKLMKNHQGEIVESMLKEAQDELSTLGVLYQQANKNSIAIYDDIYGGKQTAVLMPKIPGVEAVSIVEDESVFSNESVFRVPVSHRFNSLNSFFTQLTELHKQGFIHSDIKLNNTLITDHIRSDLEIDGVGYDGNYNVPFMSIIDLGVAVQVNELGEKLFYKCGTPIFMAEEAFNEGKSSTSSDIYSASEIMLSTLGSDTVSSYVNKLAQCSALAKELDHQEQFASQEERRAKYEKIIELQNQIKHYDYLVKNSLSDTYQIHLHSSQPGTENFGLSGLSHGDNSITAQIQKLFDNANQYRQNSSNIIFKPDNLSKVIQMSLHENPLARPTAAELSGYFASHETMMLKLEIIERYSRVSDAGPIDQILYAEGMTKKLLQMRVESMPLSMKLHKVRKLLKKFEGEDDQSLKQRLIDDPDISEQLSEYIYNSHRTNTISVILNDWLSKANIDPDQSNILVNAINQFSNNNLSESDLLTTFSETVPQADINSIFSEAVNEYITDNLQDVENINNKINSISDNICLGLIRKNPHAYNPREEKIKDVEAKLAKNNQELFNDNLGLAKKSSLIQKNIRLCEEIYALKNDSANDLYQYHNYEYLIKKKSMLSKAMISIESDRYGDGFVNAFIYLTGGEYFDKLDKNQEKIAKMKNSIQEKERFIKGNKFFKKQLCKNLSQKRKKLSYLKMSNTIPILFRTFTGIKKDSKDPNHQKKLQNVCDEIKKIENQIEQIDKGIRENTQEAHSLKHKLEQFERHVEVTSSKQYEEIRQISSSMRYMIAETLLNEIDQNNQDIQEFKEAIGLSNEVELDAPHLRQTS